MKINKVKTELIEFGFNNEKAGNRSDHNVRLGVRIINRKEKFEYKLCEKMEGGELCTQYDWIWPDEATAGVLCDKKVALKAKVEVL